jgi:hypothetical protein
MRRFHRVGRGIAVGILALGTSVASAERYPTPAKLKQVRTAALHLSPDGVLARLDPVEWCEELEQFLRERGHRGVRQYHRQVLSEVVVPLPSPAFRAAAQEIVRVLTSAPAPLSRFRARFEVRRFDNSVLSARYEGEQWKEARESRPDPLPFTLELAPGQWMMSVELDRPGGVRIAIWDKVGEANPFEVLAVLALPDGSVHRSRRIPWNPAGVVVYTPDDFPTLRSRELARGRYRVIFEADGRTIDWPRSLRFRY